MPDQVFTKEKLDSYLKELAKEFRKLNGTKMPAEIILTGGAAILLHYGFREMTYDIDAIIHASSSMKDAINNVGDRLNLPTGWLNTDFMKTTSYSPKLVQYSKYYKTFSNVLRIRFVSAEFLIAMKLMAGRQYKNDLSDVIGILLDEERAGKKISLSDVEAAATKLYGGYEKLPEMSRAFFEKALATADLSEEYKKIRESEKGNKKILVAFEKNYPDVLNSDNLSDVLKAAREKL